MSEDAQQFITDFEDTYRDLKANREEGTDLNFRIIMRATQLHTAGLLAIPQDPDVLAEEIGLVDKASLR